MILGGEPVIRVQNVFLSYVMRSGLFHKSRVTTLSDISFEVHSGETVGIIGRNGVGKSTLLRLVAGIIAPDRGRIIRQGGRISLLSLGVGFAAHLTGRQNAMLSGMLLGLSKADMAAKMDSVIEFSGLGSFIDRPLGIYSSGMRARLGFSVAIQVDPDMLLIDEILGVGDEEFRIKSSEELKRLIKSEKSVVLVSHNPSTLRELCDRLIWIEGGSIKKVGPTSDLLAEYTRRV